MKASAIKKELKQAGFNPKDFKVTVKTSYDTCIYVTIKNPYVNRKEIEKVLSHHVSADYDVATYEILCGTNPFVCVSYAYEAIVQASEIWHYISLSIIENERNDIKIADDLRYIDGQLHQHNENGSCCRDIYDAQHLSVYLFRYATFGSIDI